MEKVGASSIKKITTIFLGNINIGFVLELMQNNIHSTFSIGINDDGETIFCANTNYWDKLLGMPLYSQKIDANINNLIDCKIQNILYGIGTKLYTSNHVIYYIKIETDIDNLLFFNNGDEAHMCTGNDVDKILENDIYGFEWSNNLPLIWSKD